MKDKVLILSKTKRGSDFCVGGITFKGKFVRLLNIKGGPRPENSILEPRQIWEIEYDGSPKIAPPHVEDIFVIKSEKKNDLEDSTTVLEFLEKGSVPIWKGNPHYLFNGLIQWTDNGSGFIDNSNIPKNSVGFWMSDKDLIWKEFNGVRYQYSSNPWRSIKFKGFQKPIPTIPAGTLLRVSLARWFSPSENEEQKCWLQLSGWYDLD